MSIDEAFAVVVKDLRRKAKLSQTDVADFLGFARQSVWEMERAKVSTKLVTMQKLASLYEMTLEELVKRTVITARDRIE